MGLNNKKHRWILFLIILIIAPIVFQQVSSMYKGYMTQQAMKRPKTVNTILPLVQNIYSESESAGRVKAKYSVDIVARINGWLQKSYFEEGAKVEKGQTLFLIEPDEYRIAVNNAAAAVRQAQAAYTNSEKELKRADELVKNDYVSKSYYDQALATRDANRASLDSAKARLENARLNLSYTNIKAPVDGKIGKIIITQGNLVNPQVGPIARVVSTSPIYVTFTLKSSEYLKFKKYDSTTDFTGTEVRLQLADGTIYDEVGRIEFIDNEVDETMGTLTLRATFDNEDEMLVPGDFVKVIVKSATPRELLTVPQSAALNDAQGYYVWTIDENNKAQRKGIKVSQEVNKYWVVEEGLEPTDKIVGKGLQSIRMPGQVVNPVPLVEEKAEEQVKEEAKQ